ncbi:hypothetical protein B0A79_24070 [Flavobacterium piscis]|uniref:Uncharacterized protein n=1 Tax=Flavobacterium piscis TaxID=1114874 RepID=A0ABX2XIN2_9FLAO|nr:hypothetical protein [Flavobacterium piscis]OCB73838.1 hypothetical protein FLP_14295 [Flavobacterium piscis]OXE95795.1 hypothetical protein B0A79_24070 [Flavobacterium piscis]
MPAYLFDQDSSEKKLKQLIVLYDKFMEDPDSSEKALQIATEAWHLTDWVHKEFQTTHNIDILGDFRETLYPYCNSLKIMHDLANSSKHGDTSRPKAGIQSAYLYEGDFDPSDFSMEEFEVSRLEIILTDNSKLYFDEEITKVVDFWKDYFRNELNITL